MSAAASLSGLKLSRPLVVFDLEATGLNVNEDRIVSICAAKLAPDAEMTVRYRLLDPEVPISPDATAVHGITDADVQGQPTFRQVARSMADFFGAADLAGFNIVRFDVPLLLREFQRAGVPFPTADRHVVDAYQIFSRREPRSLSAAMQFYCGQVHEQAHDAQADVLATIKVLAGQLHRYQDLPRRVEELDRIYNPMRGHYVDWQGKLRWQGGQIVVGFGRHRGRSLAELVHAEPEFLQWLLDGDFSDEVKRVVAAAIAGEPLPPPS